MKTHKDRRWWTTTAPGKHEGSVHPLSPCSKKVPNICHHCQACESSNTNVSHLEYSISHSVWFHNYIKHKPLSTVFNTSSFAKHFSLQKHRAASCVHVEVFNFLFIYTKISILPTTAQTIGLEWERMERKVFGCRIESRVAGETWVPGSPSKQRVFQLTYWPWTFLVSRPSWRESHRLRGAAPRQPSAWMIRDSGGKRM